ncbi:hypothetical protein J2T57_001382 [Natronocella acetinitrilica]|uniref:Conjugal transfer protein TrbI n=1 Tax=Natronocella acetinitrilica TaxID=414046 RepID=A0AAE3G235_9GAMM|nr:DotG/IcmE/VirB10 family protein [Natronocella acetinitrilica]MCP1674280.1 hypothetical protein [Natronocella acetinitrilica]
MMIMSIAISMGAALLGIYLFSGSSSAPEPAGGASVRLAPDERQIARAQPGDEDLFPEGSPARQEIDEIRERRIEEAQRDSSATFIDTIRIRNEALADERRIAQQINEQRRPSTGIDDVRANEQARAAQANPRAPAAVPVQQPHPADRAAPGAAGAAQSYGVVSMVDPMFIRSELERANSRNNALGSAVSRAAGIEDRARPLDASGASSGGGSRPGGSARQSGSSQPGGSGYYDQYSFSAQHGVQVPQDSDMDRFRVNLVDSEGNPIEQFGPGGSRPPATARSGSAQQGGSARSTGEYPSDRAAAAHRAGQQSKLINVGTQVYAYLHNEANSDEPSPLFATVLQEGPLKGAILTSTGPQRVGEKLILQFNTLAIGDQTYSVDALATEVDDWQTRLADGVNRHTFERYFKLGAAAFASGYVRALSGTTTTSGTTGTTTVQERLPDSRDQAAVAVGTIGERLLPKYEAYFDRPPTITVRGRRPIGIVFMSPLELE